MTKKLVAIVAEVQVVSENFLTVPDERGAVRKVVVKLDIRE